MCTAMLFDPEEAAKKIEEARLRKAEAVVVTQDDSHIHKHREFKGNFKLFERWVHFKQYVLLKTLRRKDGDENSSDKPKSFLSIFFW